MPAPPRAARPSERRLTKLRALLVLQEPEVVATLRKAKFEGLMTHFASASDYSSPQTDQQEACFHSIRQHLRQRGLHPEYTHLSSTVGIAYGRKSAWGNLVRPGHAIYGYVSPARGDAPKRILNVKPALTWKATIIAIKDLPEGALVGYGGMFRTTRPSPRGCRRS